jgi:hypothetical protein
MPGFFEAKYVQLRQRDGHFELVLLDENRQPVGHGYKGPTVRRAEQDLKYWTRDRGLQELPNQSDN